MLARAESGQPVRRRLIIALSYGLTADCAVRWEVVLQQIDARMSAQRPIPINACVDRYARRIGGRRRAKKDSDASRCKRRLVSWRVETLDMVC